MKNILYTRDFDEKIEEEVNVILSPQFYWIKKIDIPIKNRTEARKIAKNVFDLENSEYFFDAVELNNIFYAIAIRKDLELSIDKKYIKSLRIAQCELDSVDCINLPNKFSLQKFEDIFFCFPGHKDKCMCLYNILEKISLSKYEFSFFNRLNIDKLSINFILIGLVMLLSSFLIKGISYKSLMGDMNAKMDALSNYNLPLNNYQLDAMLSDFKTQDNFQKKIRDKLSYIQRVPLKKDEKFIQLKYSKVGYVIEISSTRNFDDYFSKKFKIIESKQSKNSYKVVLNAN